MLNGYSSYCYERIKKKRKLEDLDVSEEINACCINVDVEIDGKLKSI